MALVPEHDKCAGYFNVESIISECIDQGEDPYAEGPVATNVRPFKTILQGQSGIGEGRIFVS